MRFSRLPISLTLVALMGGPTVLSAVDNLLTNSPGFESSSGSTYNGTISIGGWTLHNWRYNWAGVVGGGASEGNNYVLVNYDGGVELEAGSRPAAKPNRVYEVQWDQQTIQTSWPDDYAGCTMTMSFYDSAGTLLKETKGLVNGIEAQAHATAGWQTFRARAVAPANTAKVGLFWYMAQNIWPNQDGHTSDLDNVRVYEIAETQDQVGFRRASHALTAGKTAEVVVKYAATADKDVLLRLVSNSTSYSETRTQVTAGRGVLTLAPTVPANAPTGNYSWQLQVVPRGGNWGSATVSRVDSAAFVDPGESTTLTADSDRFVYQGRIDRSNGNAQPILHWYGSTVNFRFSGTSLQVRGGSYPNGYGGYLEDNILVVIDGDWANPKSLYYNSPDTTVSAVTGLANGVHSAVIFKQDESNLPFIFRGVALDSGKGLLRPEPLPTRKLDIYGDSVTSGGEAIPRTLGYAPTLGRSLGCDTQVISKGGTGVAASWSGQALLSQYWNQLHLLNVFYVAPTDPTWDFTTRQAQAVLVGIGHNDQFNGGADTWVTAYKNFIASLHGTYANAQVFSYNTVISCPDRFLAGCGGAAHAD